MLPTLNLYIAIYVKYISILKEKNITVETDTKWSHNWGSIIQKSDTDSKDDNGWLHLAPEMNQPASELALPADTVNLAICDKLPNPADNFATPCMAE